MDRLTAKLTLSIAAALVPAGFAADAKDAARIEYFEKHVRPVLSKNCFSCHGPKKEHNGLRLDSRAGMLKGGDSGPALVPGKPDDSALVQAIRHESFEMPPDGKLTDLEIAAIEKWVADGAVWPVDANAVDLSTKSFRERALEHWAFQPIQNPAVPETKNKTWSNHPVDRFILDRLEKANLKPNAPADPRTLVRRVHYTLTGLPPTPAEVDQFLGDNSPDAYEKLVDRLLDSPRFGEHWARHWMDWVRYSESHGSEGDPKVPFAWEFRDYLIRGLNADVGWNQLIREQIAGDLLDKPRINRELALNESAIGPAQFRMVFHGYAPVDPLDELVTFTENQVDVTTKAFLGLTVACARCHDHKFDAISQADFHALFGIFISSRPGQIIIDAPDRFDATLESLAEQREAIRKSLIEEWRAALPNMAARLAAVEPAPAPPEKSDAKDPKSREPEAARQLRESQQSMFRPLNLWTTQRNSDKDAIARQWNYSLTKNVERSELRKNQFKSGFSFRWDLRGSDYYEWFRDGLALPEHPAKAGEFAVLPSGDRAIAGVYPAGVYSHRLSTKQRTVLTSPRFKIDSDRISVRLMGNDAASARLVLENYPLTRGPIYAQRTAPEAGVPTWVTWNTTYWKDGFHGYIEIATADDLTFTDAKRQNPINDGRSAVGVAEIAFHAADVVPLEGNDSALLLLQQQPPATAEEMADRYRKVAESAIAAWENHQLTDDQSAFLNDLVQNNVLPNKLSDLPKTAGLIAEYRKTENAMPVPRRAPGVVRGTAIDQPLYIRGDHKRPGKVVPRRFLDAFASQPYKTNESGRRELAEDFVSPNNPLTPRVMTNRIWHYLFDRGLVSTVDNFGKLGDKPTHPELLDYLTTQFVDSGWSAKKMIRELVLSRTYRTASEPSGRAREIDPSNLLLSHMPVRRLEAEEIRDSILSAAGKLGHEMYGPGVEHYRRDPLQKRSVYLASYRNQPIPFLEVFDAPKPFTTLGRRDSTNVPAQSLTMLNDPFVIGMAKSWGDLLVRENKDQDVEGRIARIYQTALSRQPTSAELSASIHYVQQLASLHGLQEQDVLKKTELWRDYTQAIFNLKEFIYIR